MNKIMFCLILFSSITACLTKKEEDTEPAPTPKGKSFFLFGAFFRRIRQRWMGGYQTGPGPLYTTPTYPVGSYYSCPMQGCNPVYRPIAPPQTQHYYNQPLYGNSQQYLEQQLTQQQQQQQQQQYHHHSNVVIYHNQDQMAQQYPQQYQVGAVPMPIPLHPVTPSVVLAPNGSPSYANYPAYPAGISYQNYPPTAHQNSYNVAYPAGVPFVGTATAAAGASCGTPMYPCGAGK